MDFKRGLNKGRLALGLIRRCGKGSAALMLSFALAIVGATLPGTAIAGGYSLITPYSQPGTETTVTGINDAGFTTGDITDAKGIGPAFICDPSGDYQTFDNPPNDPSKVSTQAGDINNNNQVTANTLGYYKDTKSAAEFILAPGGAETNISDPKDGDKLFGNPKGINDAGVVVGDYWQTNNGVAKLDGFELSGSTMTKFDFGSATAVEGVNDAGVLVGWAETSPGTATGFVDIKGSPTFVADPHATAGASTFFEDVNDHGNVVGEWVGANAESHPFEFNTRLDKFIEFKLPSGGIDFSALGINNRNQVILTNDAGVNYRYDPFASGVPEPGAWALMIVGMGGLGVAIRRRRGAAASV